MAVSDLAQGLRLLLRYRRTERVEYVPEDLRCIRNASDQFWVQSLIWLLILEHVLGEGEFGRWWCLVGSVGMFRSSVAFVGGCFSVRVY